MSVVCLQMVDAVASGVMYSHHPFNVRDDNLLISAVWGLGPYAVDGVITPDTYRVAKTADLAILDLQVSRKTVQLVPKPGAGLQEIPVPPELQDQPCLSPAQIKVLAGYGVKLEEHYHCPQDVEWALDQAGRLLVLQSRPLRPAGPHRQGAARHPGGARLSRAGGGRRRRLPRRGMRPGLPGPRGRGSARFPRRRGVGGPAFFPQICHGDAQGPGHRHRFRQHLRPHGFAVPGIFPSHPPGYPGGHPDHCPGPDRHGGRLHLPHLSGAGAGIAGAPAGPGIPPQGHPGL